jgi:hypothetical protein
VIDGVIKNQIFTAYIPVTTTFRLSLVTVQYIAVYRHGFPVTHVEEGYNTSTVALGVVRGDKKGTQCPGV